MSFFKKIGSFVKTAAKQVSFKNAVNIVKGLDPSGIIGGIQDAHYAKKANDDYNAQLLIAEQANKMGKVTGGLAQQFVGSVVGNTLNAAGQGAKDGLGTVGAQIADASIKAWFHKHWQKLAIAVAGLVGTLVIVKLMRNKQPNNYRRAR